MIETIVILFMCGQPVAEKQQITPEYYIYRVLYEDEKKLVNNYPEHIIAEGEVVGVCT